MEAIILGRKRTAASSFATARQKKVSAELVGKNSSLTAEFHGPSLPLWNPVTLSGSDVVDVLGRAGPGMVDKTVG